MPTRFEIRENNLNPGGLGLQELQRVPPRLHKQQILLFFLTSQILLLLYVHAMKNDKNYASSSF